MNNLQCSLQLLNQWYSTDVCTRRAHATAYHILSEYLLSVNSFIFLNSLTF